MTRDFPARVREFFDTPFAHGLSMNVLLLGLLLVGLVAH